MIKLEHLYKSLLTPSPRLIDDISKIDGDIIILGVGGKMGPSLAILAKQACDAAGVQKRILGVARFTDSELADKLLGYGIEIIKADLLNDDELDSLPDAPNVIYMAGTKFGTKGNEPYTWAMNTYLPGRVAQKYKNSRIVVFSTGNVYPFTTIEMGGATETTTPAPIGEYGQSCLGRERLFQYFASLYNTPILIYRLNYAIDVSYGVLLEIGQSVYNQSEIDLSMGHVNMIWQGDANEIAIQSLLHTACPAKILNVTGDKTYSIRWLATEMGRALKKTPIFINQEQTTALLSNASECVKLFGTPRTEISQMIEVICEWIIAGGKTLNKPTHFTERSGNF